MPNNADICPESEDAGADDGAGDAGAAWRTQGGTTTRRASAGAAGNASDGQHAGM